MLEVPATVDNVRKALRISIRHGLTVSPALQEVFQNIPVVTTIPGFAFTLKYFQAEGVAWLESQAGRGLLADEPGTGKTVTVMAYAHKNHTFPMAVVCPNSLKFNWRNEVLATTGSTYRINVVGKSYSKAQTRLRTERHPNVVYSRVPTPGCDIYIINYENLARDVECLEGMKLQLLAVDESQKIKNAEARRTQAYMRLSTGMVEEKQKGGLRFNKRVGPGMDRVVLMSGTPMVSRPRELWTSVNSLASYVPEFSTFKKFAWRYCAPVNNGFGWNFNGSSNEQELGNLLREHMMIRRLKKDVLPELPPKQFRTIPLEFDRAEYDRVASAFDGINWRAGMEAIIRLGGNVPKSDAAIVAIQKLREIAARAKLDSTVEFIQDYTEEGEKLVVMAHHRDVIETIQERLLADPAFRDGVRVIYGGIKPEETADAVLAFQQDPSVRVIIVGMTSGGFGLTLTAAKAVAFVQLPWTPGEVSQCIDRIHRHGQDADLVTIYNLVAEFTVEEDMADMIIGKGLVLDAVLDKGDKVNTLDLKVSDK